LTVKSRSGGNPYVLKRAAGAEGDDRGRQRRGTRSRTGTLAVVAYDIVLADTIRELLAPEPGVTEKRMFGGLAFLVHGNLAIAASGQGGALVRIDPADSARLVASTAAEVAVMRERTLPGWLRVPFEAMQNRKDVTGWVRLGVDYARSLPPK
jgi:TfoX/Sxy family transcriptional regulator of competence genes